jgi:phospholipid/cholesterol/gamma-HCH transport system substrate-binding protein
MSAGIVRESAARVAPAPEATRGAVPPPERRRRIRADDFVVGLVVLLGAAILLAASLWLGRAQIGDDRAHLSARFRDVGHAKVGAAVVIRGVEAGRIVGIELADAGWVEVRLQLGERVRLPDDPVVLLGESSLFGDWQAIVLERAALPSDPSLRAQIEAASGGANALPGATLPDVAQLTTAANRIAGDVGAVAERIRVAFDDSAAAELRTAIRRTAGLSARLDRTVQAQSRNLDTVATDVLQAVRALAGAASRLERTAARVDSSTSEGEMRRIVDNIAAASADVRDASASLRRTGLALERSQGSLETLLARSDSVLAKIDRGEGSLGLLVNDPSLYRNGDSLAVRLRELVDDIRANPKRYLTVEIF